MMPRERIRVQAVGLGCPLPIYKLKKALDQIAPGEAVVLETDDLAVCREVRALVRRLGLELVESSGPGDVVNLYVRKS